MIPMEPSYAVVVPLNGCRQDRKNLYLAAIVSFGLDIKCPRCRRSSGAQSEHHLWFWVFPSPVLLQGKGEHKTSSTKRRNVSKYQSGM